MKRKPHSDRRTDALEPSPLVRRFASKIAHAAAGMPVLDVACGSGRNAIFLSQLGCTVICVDKDLTRLQAHQLRLCTNAPFKASTQLSLHYLDLVKDPWPFASCAVGGIVNVHFFLPALFPFFETSLSPGGYLLLETIPGCGGNYLKLPKAGEVRSAFAKSFDFEFYKEGKVGPSGYDAVTVQAFARRRGNQPM